MKLAFHFDFLSPYAYLAWTQIHALAARHGAVVEPVPVLFAALLAHHGTKGPAEIPAKRAYLFKDITRLAHRFGVPIAPPAVHPFNPLLPLRASSLDLDPDVQKRLVDGLFAATWAERRRVDTPEVVADVARSVGLDGAAIVEAANRDDTKAKLKSATERAIAAGVFGIPTTIVDGELFWGVDSLEHLETWLRGEDPVARHGNPFVEIPVGATRRI